MPRRRIDILAQLQAGQLGPIGSQDRAQQSRRQSRLVKRFRSRVVSIRRGRVDELGRSRDVDDHPAFLPSSAHGLKHDHALARSFGSVEYETGVFTGFGRGRVEPGDEFVACCSSDGGSLTGLELWRSKGRQVSTGCLHS